MSETTTGDKATWADAFSNFVLRRRRLTWLALIAMSVVAGLGYRYNPPLKPAGVGDEEEAGVQLANDDFGRRRTECVLTIDLPEGARGDMLEPARIRVVRAIVGALENAPQVVSIDWVDTIPVLNVFGLRESLLPPDGSTEEQFVEARRRALEHPLVRGQLSSDDARTLLVPIRLDLLEIQEDDDCDRHLLEIAERAAAAHPDEPVRLALTGIVPLYLAQERAFQRNQVKFQTISYSLVFLISLILFRTPLAVMIVAGGPALGIFWTMGLLRYLNERNNPLTEIVLPVLLTMVGLTDGVHLMVFIRRLRLQHPGLSMIDAARQAMHRIGTACWLTSLTTAVGFASLLVAKSEYVRGFGKSCAIGVLITFVSVLTFIPLMCTTPWARNLSVGSERDLIGRGVNRFQRVIEWVLAHARGMSFVAVAVTIALTCVALTLRPDDRIADSQPTGSEAYQALEHCDEVLGGVEFVRVLVRWPERLNERSPEILETLQEVEGVLGDQSLIRHPLSILGILASFPGDEHVTSRLPFIDLLPDSVRKAWFDTATRRAVVSARIQDLGIGRYRHVFTEVKRRLAEISERRPGFEFELAGEPVRRAETLFSIVIDLAKSLATASLIIFGALGVAYRSLRLGLISVIPNVFPLAVTATTLVVIGRPLDIATVCSFTVCLGIAVDDTIHFLTRYREELAVDGDSRAAISRAFQGVGGAMIVTTFILMAGFGTVLTSDLPGHRTFSAMAVSTLGAALVGDMLFLPALLHTFPERRRSKPARGEG